MNTVDTWLAEVEKNKDVLRQFISQFHPGMHTYTRKSAHITAPNAEVACQNVCSQIKRNTVSNPLEDFDEAIKNKDWHKIKSLLNSAWFGVPETTSCWLYTGFTEAVRLMEDTPDMEV